MNDYNLKSIWAIWAIMSILMLMIVAHHINRDMQIEIENAEFDFTYHNEETKTKIRYKYITEYESLDDISEPYIYKLVVDEEIVSIASREGEVIPVVTDPITVKKNEVIKSRFLIERNENVNKDRVRIDVSIIIEELKGGKWSPVYQVIFMERGPYWSLNKGPIEFIKEEIE